MTARYRGANGVAGVRNSACWCDYRRNKPQVKKEQTMATKNLTQSEKQQIAFEETERELGQMQEEMWDLLKKVTTEHVGSVYTQLDMIEEASKIAKQIRAVMDARNVVANRRAKKGEGPND